MRLSKEEMTRPEMPKPPMGWVLMRVKKELAAKNPAQWSFILENGDCSFYFNCWRHDVPDFAQACGIELDPDGGVDTSLLLERWVNVFFEQVNSKKGDGKTYQNLTNFEPVSPESIPAEKVTNIADEDIPF